MTGPEQLGELEAAVPSRPVHLGYVNAHSLNLAYRDETYRTALQSCAYLLNDGIGLSLAARMRGLNFPDDLNGSDFTLRVLALAAKRDWGVFLYGGEGDVAQRAAEALHQRVPGVRIVGVQDGFSGERNAVARRVRDSGADVVIVALGNPLQELWLNEWLPGNRVPARRRSRCLPGLRLWPCAASPCVDARDRTGMGLPPVP